MINNTRTILVNIAIKLTAWYRPSPESGKGTEGQNMEKQSLLNKTLKSQFPFKLLNQLGDVSG
jgi:hypothetical protein